MIHGARKITAFATSQNRSLSHTYTNLEKCIETLKHIVSSSSSSSQIQPHVTRGWSVGVRMPLPLACSFFSPGVPSAAAPGPNLATSAIDRSQPSERRDAALAFVATLLLSLFSYLFSSLLSHFTFLSTRTRLRFSAFSLKTAPQKCAFVCAPARSGSVQYSTLVFFFLLHNSIYGFPQSNSIARKRNTTVHKVQFLSSRQ